MGMSLADGESYSAKQVETLLRAYAGLRPLTVRTRSADRGPRQPSRDLEARLLDIEDALSRIPDDLFELVELLDLEDRGLESVCAWFGNIHENTVRNRHDRAVQMIVDMLNGVVPRPAQQRSISWEYVVGEAPAKHVQTLDDIIREHYLTPEFLETAEITLLRTQRGPRFLLSAAGSTVARQLVDELGDIVIETGVPRREEGGG